MPAKKKQQSTSDDDAQLDKITQMANEIFSEAGITTSEQKQQQKQMRQMADEIRKQQLMYYDQQMKQQMVQNFAMQQEQLVANRTQHPMADVALEAHQLKWQELAPGKWIRYEQFTPKYMEQIMKMFAEELPEPYSVFTYEHFLSGWPILGILLFGFEGAKAPSADDAAGFEGQLIGSIVSRVTFKYPQANWRGYIAMLAVRPNWRGHRLGQSLVKVTVEVMKKKRATEVVLETPVSNDRALKLYTEMGFAKTKFLTRYYLDGSDAIRLKLWFHSPRE